jgi:hypothetical protein
MRRGSGSKGAFEIQFAILRFSHRHGNGQA